MSSVFACRTYLNRIYVDSLVHDPDALELLLKKFGPDKIILGTDYPFPLGELEPGNLIKGLTSIDGETKEKMLYRNAIKFLNLVV